VDDGADLGRLRDIDADLELFLALASVLGAPPPAPLTHFEQGVVAGKSSLVRVSKDGAEAGENLPGHGRRSPVGAQLALESADGRHIEPGQFHAPDERLDV
jgi:hypothetical protein